MDWGWYSFIHPWIFFFYSAWMVKLNEVFELVSCFQDKHWQASIYMLQVVVISLKKRHWPLGFSHELFEGLLASYYVCSCDPFPHTLPSLVLYSTQHRAAEQETGLEDLSTSHPLCLYHISMPTRLNTTCSELPCHNNSIWARTKPRSLSILRPLWSNTGVWTIPKEKL